MLDKLVDLFLQFVGLFKFWIVCHHYERIMILRFGKPYTIRQPGIWWLLPFNIDYEISIRVDEQSNSLQPITVTTADGHVVTVGMEIKWSVGDVRKIALLIKNDEQLAFTQCHITTAMMIRTSLLEDLYNPDWHEELEDTVRLRAREDGIRVHEFALTEFAVTEHTVRLYNETQAPSPPFRLN